MKTLRMIIALLAIGAMLVPSNAYADKKYRRTYRHYHYGPGYYGYYRGYYPYGYHDPYYAVPYGPVYGPGPYVYTDNPGVAMGALFGGLMGSAIANS